MRLPAFVASVGVLATVVVAACSVVNNPDDPIEPTGVGGGVGGSGGGIQCQDDGECSALSDECNQGVCTNGTCQAMPEPAGTACGSADASECDGADLCDGMGACDTAVSPNGTPCNECPAGPGLCDRCESGVCEDCVTYAATQSFVRDDSIDGWTIDGGWGLYREAPRNLDSFDVVPFGKQVFGTDGNRVPPYPGNEVEMSRARTRPSTLPATLNFRSWHVDEGVIDTKRISVSIDGGTTFVDIANCAGPPPLNAFPFCTPVVTRMPDQWDMVSITVPTMMVGQVGVVEFFYNTQDACCQFERGWFIDAINVATQCACDADTDCAYVTDECAAGACNDSSGECRLTAEPVDTPCGDQTVDIECDRPDSCDGGGYCSERHTVDGAFCFDCPAGGNNCKFCQEGVCPDCTMLQPVNGFDTPLHIFSWQLTGGWNRYGNAPPSQQYTSGVVFPTGAFGTDGNRVAPYPGNETENSTARTRPFFVPPQITFSSWHVDEGGGTDRKMIRISTDGGTTFTPIVDCGISGMNAYAFCPGFTSDRPATVQDQITIDTSAFAGQIGILEFAMNTNDSCCSFERGWYIDNLNVTQLCLQ